MTVVSAVTTRNASAMTSELDFEVYDNGDISLFPTVAGGYEARDKEGKALCSGLCKDDVLFWARNHLFGPLPGVETYVTNIKFNSVPKL